jgi:DNA-binding MarR family transcriptional regulator
VLAAAGSALALAAHRRPDAGTGLGAGVNAAALSDVRQDDAMSTTKSVSRKQIVQGVLDNVVGYHIARARVTTHGLFVKHVGQPLDLRPVEYSLLMLLAGNEQVTPKQLAQALALSAPNLTLLLDRMQERGVIQRVRSETDRRSQIVMLTDTGRQLTDRALTMTPDMEQGLSGCLSQAEHAMLIELLDKVARHHPG